MVKKIFQYTLLACLAGIFIWTIWFLYQKSIKVPEVYNTEIPFITDIVKKTVSSGSVMPRKEIAVKSQVSGVVDQLYAEAGQYVKKGDLIARIKIIPNMVSLNKAETDRNQADISYRQSKREFDRYQKLYDEKLISEAEYNRYLLDYNKTKEQLDAAENNFQLIKEGTSAKSGKTSNNLIRSTVDGMILDIPVKEGGFVIESNTFNEGTTIASIADMNDMIFIGKVEESEVGKIYEGIEMTLSIGAINNRTYKAKLEFISPKGVEEDGAIKFEIKAAIVMDKKEFIRSGFSANADIILEKKEKVLAVKEALIQYGKDSTYVEIETKPKPQQTFVKKVVKLGISDGINVEVLSGLNAKDKIKVLLNKGVK